MAQLVVNLKKADRNVHVAISIVLGMLMLMSAITMVTHGQRFTHQRSKSLGKSLASHLPGQNAIAQRHKPKAMAMAMPRMKPKLAAQTGRKYTDCQGRAIYNTARRNAVVIEMKQPPTWLVWLNDYLTTSWTAAKDDSLSFTFHQFHFYHSSHPDSIALSFPLPV